MLKVRMFCHQKFDFGQSSNIGGMSVPDLVYFPFIRMNPDTNTKSFIDLGQQPITKYRLFAVYKTRHFLDFLIYYGG